MGSESAEILNMAFWNTHPCGSHEEKPLYRIRRERYAENPWLPRFIRFGRWKGKGVLEIGCGMGLDASTFSEFGARMVCLDLSSKSLMIAKTIVDGELVNGSAKTVGGLFAKNKFDLVYSFGVLHHIPEAQRVVKQIHDILVEGGKVIAAVYNKNSVTYWKSLLVNGLLRGGFFKGKSAKELLGPVECGASSKLKPYVTCYTTKTLKKLFSDFKNIKTEIHALSPRLFPVRLPRSVLKSLEMRFGWFIILEATK